MIIGLIISMVLIGYVSIKVCSDLPEGFIILPVIIMLGLDILCVFGFREFLGMEDKSIAFSIVLATIFKVIMFVLMNNNKDIFSSTSKRF